MSKPKSAEAAVGNALDRFLQTLGIMDFVSGGLVLYFIWLSTKLSNDNSWVTYSTGFSYLDTALLAICAVAVGRALSASLQILHGVALVLVGLRYDLSDHLKEYSINGPQLSFVTNLMAEKSPNSLVEYSRSREAALYSLTFSLLAFAYAFEISSYLFVVSALLAIRYILELFSIYGIILTALSWIRFEDKNQ